MLRDGRAQDHQREYDKAEQTADGCVKVLAGPSPAGELGCADDGELGAELKSEHVYGLLVGQEAIVHRRVLRWG